MHIYEGHDGNEEVLDLGKAKRMSTESLMKLAEFVLSNYIFEYNLSF